VTIPPSGPVFDLLSEIARAPKVVR